MDKERQPKTLLNYKQAITIYKHCETDRKNNSLEAEQTKWPTP